MGRLTITNIENTYSAGGKVLYRGETRYLRGREAIWDRMPRETALKMWQRWEKTWRKWKSKPRSVFRVKSFLGVSQVWRPRGRTVFDLLEEQGRDQCVWKGGSEQGGVWSRGQQGSCRWGTARGGRVDYVGIEGKSHSITDTLSEVRSYWRVLSRGVAWCDLHYSWPGFP